VSVYGWFFIRRYSSAGIVSHSSAVRGLLPSSPVLCPWRRFSFSWCLSPFYLAGRHRGRGESPSRCGPGARREHQGGGEADYDHLAGSTLTIAVTGAMMPFSVSWACTTATYIWNCVKVLIRVRGALLTNPFTLVRRLPPFSGKAIATVRGRPGPERPDSWSRRLPKSWSRAAEVLEPEGCGGPRPRRLLNPRSDGDPSRLRRLWRSWTAEKWCAVAGRISEGHRSRSPSGSLPLLLEPARHPGKYPGRTPPPPRIFFAASPARASSFRLSPPLPRRMRCSIQRSSPMARFPGVACEPLEATLAHADRDGDSRGQECRTVREDSRRPAPSPTYFQPHEIDAQNRAG